MSESNKDILMEIRDMLKILVEEQRQLMDDVRILKSEQQKIHDEIRMSNHVLNNISLRNEILN